MQFFINNCIYIFIGTNLVKLCFTDISLAEMRSEPVINSPNTYFSKPESVVEDCLCSGLYNNKNSFVSSPSDMLNKILRSNDLFSFNKEPVTSPTCCESHEHVQEDTVFFELGPKPHQIDVNHQPQPNNPVLPLIFENLFPNKPSLPTLPMKPKAIEIFFFPKKKETQQEFLGKDIFGKDFMQTQTKKKDLMGKSEIQIVGDKELRNDFQSLKFRPSFSITSFGKKDTGMEKEKVKDYVEQTTEASVDNKQEANTKTTKKDAVVSNLNAL